MVCGMSSSNAFKPPVINGVGPSTVGIPASTTLSAIDFLSSKFSAIAREEWLLRFEAQEILNAAGRVVAPQDSLLKESHLHYYRSIRNEPELPFKATVIFQDEFLVVVDKPHFMPVTPGGRYLQQSLLVQLKQQLNLPELSPVHRIDRETAGLVVFSVRAQDRNAYQELFKLRQVEKIYEAIAGAPETSALNPKFPRVHRSLMAEDTQFFRMRELTTDAPHSHNEFNSETWIDCVARISKQKILIQDDGIKELPLARYQLKPVTGQRHQLRVHMSSLGLPLMGDQFYPSVLLGAEENENFEHPLQLLAKNIFFKDPILSFPRSFTSSLSLKNLT
jgi:tRNA pseudouridine32 synthase/23S rRNA pseudouridine746 synthase